MIEVIICLKGMHKFIVLLFHQRRFFFFLLFLNEVAYTAKIICAKLHDDVSILRTAEYFKTFDQVFVFDPHQNINLLQE